ncbi:MAG: response regulator [Candidatus Nanohaloarchaea archaeon]
MEALVVDDSAFMRNMMKQTLKDMDFEEVHEAESGEEAVEKHEEEDPDLITMDIVMGEMSGIDAVEKIRADDEDVTIVMVSAVGQEQMVDDAMDKGADDFVNKPFDEEDIKDTITELIA